MDFNTIFTFRVLPVTLLLSAMGPYVEGQNGYSLNNVDSRFRNPFQNSLSFLSPESVRQLIKALSGSSTTGSQSQFKPVTSSLDMEKPFIFNPPPFQFTEQPFYGPSYGVKPSNVIQQQTGDQNQQKPLLAGLPQDFKPSLQTSNTVRPTTFNGNPSQTLLNTLLPGNPQNGAVQQQDDLPVLYEGGPNNFQQGQPNANLFPTVPNTFPQNGQPQFPNFPNSFQQGGPTVPQRYPSGPATFQQPTSQTFPNVRPIGQVSNGPPKTNDCNNQPHESENDKYYHTSYDGNRQIWQCPSGLIFNSISCGCDTPGTFNVNRPNNGAVYRPNNGGVYRPTNSVPDRPNTFGPIQLSGGNRPPDASIFQSTGNTNKEDDNCRGLLAMSFDRSVTDTTGHYVVNNGVSVDRLLNTCSGGCGFFNGRSSLDGQVFSSNELGETLDVRFRFRPDARAQGDGFQVLLSNECEKKWLDNGYYPPSIAIKYQPGQSMELILETTKTRVQESCSPVSGADGWFDVRMTLDNGRLVLSVNNQNCVVAYVQGPVAMQQCALGIGKSLAGYDWPFVGLMDELKITKGCISRN